MCRGRLGPARPVAELDEHRLILEAAAAAPREVERAAGARRARSLGLALVCVVFGLLVGPQFLGPANLELIARQTAIVCTAALGMTLVIVAAGIDLSVGSIVSLSTVVIAIVLRHSGGPGLAALAAIGGGRGVRAGDGRAGHAAQGRAVHRHPRDDAAGARGGEGPGRRAPPGGARDLAERPAAYGATGRPGPRGRLAHGGAGARGRRGPALHAVRPAPVRDRLERAHGAAVRRARRADQDRGLLARRPRWRAWRACCSSRSCRSAIRPWRWGWSWT